MFTQSPQSFQSLLAAFLGVLVLTAFLPAQTAQAQQQDDQQKPEKGQLLEASDVQYRFETRSSRSALRAEGRARPDITTVVEQDFEDGAGDFTANGSWAVGAPTSGPGGGFESDNAAGTDLTGDYPHDADDRLVSSSISLPSVSSEGDLYLRFQEWFDIESAYDEGFVEVSTDGGSSWTEVGRKTGESDGWTAAQVNLTEYAGEDVRLAFHFTSDGSFSFSGWYVDDVRVVQEEPEPLATSITSLNARNFPNVFMNVSVARSAEDAPLLTEENFEVYEDGALQEDCFNVVPPDETGGVRLADIVFVIDNTGSMGDEIDQVRDNVINFVDRLEGSGVNFALGLTTYKDDVTVFDGGTLTQNASAFRSRVGELGAGGGGDITENGLGAMDLSLSSFTFRPGSQKIFVLITDARSHTPPDPGSYVTPDPPALDVLNSELRGSGATAYVAGPEHPQYTGAGSLTDATGGRFFFVTEPFDGILDDISSDVSDSYVLSYCSGNDEEDGTERNVRVEVNYDGNTNSGERTYVAGGEPEIARTDETKSLSRSSQSEGEPLTISAQITDVAEPVVNSARLFYRTSGSGGPFKSVQVTSDEMTTGAASASSAARPIPGDVEFGVPASDVAAPGLEYYITATDGESTTALPSTRPTERPFEIGVENETVSFSGDFGDTESDISSVPPVSDGEDVTVSITLADDGSVESAELHVRAAGELIYVTIPLDRIGSSSAVGSSKAGPFARADGAADPEGATYEANIPASTFEESSGVEYYATATDNDGVTSTLGTPDEPRNIVVQPPAPTELTAEATDGGLDLSFSASTEGDVAEYLIYRMPSSTGATTPFDSVDVGATTYTDASAEAGTRYYYRVKALSESGIKSAFSGLSSAFITPPEVSYDVSRSFGDAGASSNYRLVGLPGAEETALSEALDGSFGTGWKAFLQSEDGSGLAEAPDAALAPGGGVWVISKTDLTASSTTDAVEIAADGTATIDVHAGWNIISNPTDKALDWNAVREASGGASQPLWTFEGGSYVQAGTFAAAGAEGQAFYFNNAEGLDELVLPYAPDTSSSASSESAAALARGEASGDSPAWALALTASRKAPSSRADSAPETFHATVRAGVAKQAKTGFDAGDAFAPPGRFEAVSLRFLPTGFEQKGVELASEYRPADAGKDGQRFQLALRSTPGRPVTLRADLPKEASAKASDRKAVLVRERTGKRFALSEEKPVRLTPRAKEEQLTLLVGSNGFIEAAAEKATPAESKLIGTYPNPFRSEATIAYALADESDVELTVYDMRGRKVRTLVDERQSAGRKNATLQARSLASGVYVFRLQIGDRLETGRLVHVR
jgi:hypothetical protein